MNYIFKNASGSFYESGGQIATNEHGEPVDLKGQTKEIHDSEDAVISVYGDLSERVHDQYADRVRQHRKNVSISRDGEV